MPKANESSSDSLTVKLIGPDDQGGDVYLSTLSEFCSRLQKCLRRAESTVYGKAGNLKYRVADLQKGSAQLTLRAVRRKGSPDKRKSVFGLVKRTVRQIQTGKKPSSRLTTEDVEAYRQLAAILNHGAKGIEIDGTEITPEFIRHADEIISASIPTTGSVAGVLEKINVHNDRNEFVLFPPIQGHEIKCLFPDGMLDELRKALKRTVTVTGKLEYENDNPFPKMVRVEKMDIHPPDNELPTILELKGYAKGCTGSLSSVAFVNTLRNE